MHQAIWQEGKLQQTTPHDFQYLTISGFPLPSSGFPLPISGFTQGFQFFPKKLEVFLETPGFSRKTSEFPWTLPDFSLPSSGFPPPISAFTQEFRFFPRNLRFPDTFRLLLKTSRLSQETSRFFYETSLKIPWKLLVFSGNFSVSFEFSCDNLTVFSW